MRWAPYACDLHCCCFFAGSCGISCWSLTTQQPTSSRYLRCGRYGKREADGGGGPHVHHENRRHECYTTRPIHGRRACAVPPPLHKTKESQKHMTYLIHRCRWPCARARSAEVPVFTRYGIIAHPSDRPVPRAAHLLVRLTLSTSISFVLGTPGGREGPIPRTCIARDGSRTVEAYSAKWRAPRL